MSELEYDNQKIADYLLGNLSETEAERFDELSFTDDRFAARLESAENDLIDAYVNSELTQTELEKFKSNYLVSPLRRDKVRFAKTFQGFVKENIDKVSTEKKKTAASESEQSSGFFSSLRISANPAWRWAFAVLILAFVVGGVLIVRRQFNQPVDNVAVKQETPSSSKQETPSSSTSPKNVNTNAETAVETPTDEKNVNALPNSNRETRKKTPIPQPSLTPKTEKTLTPPPLIASFFLNPPLRGAGKLPNISFPKETETIRMTLKIEANDYQMYRVTLADETGKNLWQSVNLRSKTEALNVVFPAKLLKPQIYSLVVSGINPDGEAEIISNYPFKTVLR